MPFEAGRAIWIVLDGLGIGALPDAAVYGDGEAATLPHVAQACGGLYLPNLQSLGLGHLAAVKGVPAVPRPIGAFGRMQLQSIGKDSTTGHWELAGLVQGEPFATFPQGFPAEFIAQFEQLAGTAPLGNVAASGTRILEQLGGEHVRTGRPIVYTSVDSVFQIAAHEEILPPEQLYALCRSVRSLANDYDIGRVIARPFVGDERRGFQRTSRRRDFSMPPPQPTILDRWVEAGRTVLAIGKISDLFAGKGISRSISSSGNRDGMQKIVNGLASLPPGGLLAANLIDFDMLYGHRRDAVGFGRALEEFDLWLLELQQEMRPEDLLLVTADHGCDPTTAGTDHTREYVPILAWQKKMAAGLALGTRATFADLARTLADFAGLEDGASGGSFWPEIQSLTDS